MARQLDLVVRNGMIADGRGGEPFRGDVAISNGRITAVGRVAGTGSEELDARGMLVTPGFVDIHTHYDFQVTWEQSLLPSSNHGVTTVVMGNCGVGFAPCRPSERDLLMMLMEGIEDIPLAAMAQCLPWRWESFPEFLDFLETRSCDVDFAAQVPHGAVRVFAMGQRGADREPATEVDIAKMVRLVQEAIEAGALGFSTSRTLLHRTLAGTLAPEATAAEEELYAIAAGLGAIDKGVVQVIDDFNITSEDLSPEFEMWRRVSESSRRPISFSLAQLKSAPEQWRHLLAFVERANDDGLMFRPQVSSRAVGSLYGLELSGHPFAFCPTYAAIMSLPLDQRVITMKSADVRARIIAEAPAHPMGRGRIIGEMYAFGDPPNYAPAADSTLAARAEASGTSVYELAYDIMLEADGRAMLYYPAGNFSDGNLDASLAMLRHRDTVVGLGDGGAHVARTCDASIPTHIISYWTRDRQGERLALGAAVRMLCHDTAQLFGLGDRGVLAPGMLGDLNIIDYDRLKLRAPVARHDLPAGGTRLFQPAEGYVATIKSGTVTFRDGTATGAYPGKLVRGARGSSSV